MGAGWTRRLQKLFGPTELPVGIVHAALECFFGAQEIVFLPLQAVGKVFVVKNVEQNFAHL